MGKGSPSARGERKRSPKSPTEVSKVAKKYITKPKSEINTKKPASVAKKSPDRGNDC